MTAAHKKIIQELQQGEEKFRMLVEKSPIAVFMHNGERFIYANPITEKITGYKESELIKKTFWSIVHPDFTKIVKQRGEGRLTGGKDIPSHYKLKIICKNKAVKWVDMKASKVEYKGQLVVLGIGIDITEKVEKDKELAFKSQLLDEAKDSIIVHDLQGNIVYVNEAAYKTRGFKKEEMLKMNLKKLDSPKFAKLVELRIKELLDKGSLNLEAEHICKDGRTMPVDVHARIVEVGGEKLVISVLRDITDKQKMEIKLLNNLNLFKIITDSASDAIFAKDENRRYTFVNKTMELITGKKINDLLGKVPSEIFDKKTAQIINEVDDRCFIGKEVDEVKKIEISGNVFYLHTIQKPIFDKKNKIVGVSGVVRDVTGQKKQADKLQESEDKYRNLFNASPISLWEEDFSEVKKYIDALKKKGIKDFAKYFDDHPKEVKKCAKMVKVLLVNRATADLFEAKSPSHFVGSLGVLFSESKLSAFKETLISLSAGKKSFQSETVNYTLKGREINVLVKCSLVEESEKTWDRVIVSMLDITDRKNSEAKVIASENKFRSTFDNLMVGCQIISPDFRYAYLNDASVKHSKTTKEKLLGHTMMECYPGIEKTEVFSKIKHSLRTGQSCQMENKFIYPDGSVSWFELSIQPVPEGVVVLSNDITDKRKNEIEIEKYKFIVEQSTSQIALAKIDGELVYANNAWIKGHGYKTASDLIGKNLSVCHPKEELGKVKNFNIQLMKEGHYKGEIKHKKKDGTIFPTIMHNFVLDIQNGHKMLVGMATDISEIYLANKKIEESEIKYRNVVERSRDGIAIVSPDGIMRFANSFLAKLLGYSVEEIIGQSVKKFTHPDFHNDLEKVITAFNAGQQEMKFEAADITKDGRKIEIEDSVSPVEFEGQTCALVFVRDISHRKQHAKELEIKNMELERLNKVMVGRELRMVELKKENDRLKKKLNKL